MEINKEIWQGHEVFVIYLHMNLEESTEPTSMQKLLKNYAELFQEPMQLPPKCNFYHCITLKNKTEPVNVRAYHYAYFQKAEIEKQV